jgi:proton-translocating NAD(P)+ transhydrogenase subunit alpha
MRVAVLRETLPGEARVALVPESVKKLATAKNEVWIEAGAGEAAGINDHDYEAAGAKVTSDRTQLLPAADVLVCVQRPSPSYMAAMRPGSVVLGFLRPLDEPAALEPAVGLKLTTFAVELIPRITRAQAMDALSSMATVLGYKAVLLAATQLPRMFPMLMTAAGTIVPAKVLVLGAGVAGLQAIATAKRLGAIVEAYDVRAAAGEQVKSLGGTFLEVDLGGIATEDAGGYAKELTPEALQRGRDLIAKHARNADVIITTAAVPGKRAPLMMNDEAVLAMKRGSVIVDLAAPTGGNVSLSRPDETVVTQNGVTILAPLNLAATVPFHASQLFSRNMTSFLQLLSKDGQLNINMSDDVVGPSCVTHQGKVVNSRVASMSGQLVGK